MNLKLFHFAKKICVKIKNIKIKPKFCLLIIMPILLVFGFVLNKKIEGWKLNSSATRHSLELAKLADIKDLKNVPNANVSEYPVENPQKTALLIPQNHKYPGSKTADKINDSAQITQNQIYEIIAKLHESYGIDFIMAEGELFGPVDDKKMAVLDQKIEKRDQFAEKVKNIETQLKKENVEPETIKEFADAAAAYLNHLDREIILEGAPYAYVAKENCTDMQIYGAENEQTRNESREIVQEYIYEKDRMAQLSEKNSFSQPGMLESSFSLGLFSQPDSSSIENSISKIQTEAKSCGNDSLSKDIEQVQDDYQELEKLDSDSVKNLEADSLPKRAENPYANISDPDQMKIKMKATEGKIQQVVIDRRNRETAQYFLDSLKQNNEEIGILQYGAGHEKGLAEELNKLGVSVIVIKPDEIAKRESTASTDISANSAAGANTGAIEAKKEALLKQLDKLKKSAGINKSINPSGLELLKKQIVK